MSADGTTTDPNPEQRPSSSTTSSYTPEPAFHFQTLLKLNMKCARLRKGMYLALPSVADDAPTVLYCPEQPWRPEEVDRFHATGEAPRNLAGGGVVGATHSVWLFPWASEDKELPAMDLDDLPEPEKQFGLVYFARGDREVEAFGGEAKVIGMNLNMLKLVEVGGGQGRLELKGPGQGLDNFVDLARIE